MCIFYKKNAHKQYVSLRHFSFLISYILKKKYYKGCKFMAELSKKLIIDEIGRIIDPDLNISLEEEKSIDQIEITGSVIQIYLSLHGPLQWVYSIIKQEVLDKVSEIAPDYNVEIFIDTKKAADRPGNVLPGVKNMIAVASGKGGVGKSSIAANLAAAFAQKGAKVGVLDADIYGPSQPVMFGLIGEKLNAMQMPDGSTSAIPLEKYGIKVASMGFVMQREQAAIVRGPMLAGYFSMLFEQVHWGNLDILLFDLPPGTGDVQLTLTQKIPLTGAVVVTTPQEISLSDVRRSIAMFQKVDVDVLGIIENMSYFSPPDMPDKKYHIFGEGGGKSVAEEYNTRLLGEIPLDMNMRNSNDNGKPVVLDPNAGMQADALRDAAAEVIKEIRIKNYQAASTGGSGVEISL